jgi:hypothetical protein
MDVSDTPQLALLFRGVDAEFNIAEEMPGIQLLKDNITGKYIL